MTGARSPRGWCGISLGLSGREKHDLERGAVCHPQICLLGILIILGWVILRTADMEKLWKPRRRHLCKGHLRLQVKAPSVMVSPSLYQACHPRSRGGTDLNPGDNLSLVSCALPGDLPYLTLCPQDLVYSWRWYLRWWLPPFWQVTQWSWVSPMCTGDTCY